MNGLNWKQVCQTSRMWEWKESNFLPALLSVVFLGGILGTLIHFFGFPPKDQQMWWGYGPLMGVGALVLMAVLTAPFNGWNQAVDIQWIIDETDLSGKIILLRIKVVGEDGYVRGTGAAGGGTLFVKSGVDWVWARGDWVTFRQDEYDQWVELEFELDDPADYNEGFDPSEIVAIGFQVSTGGTEGSRCQRY